MSINKVQCVWSGFAGGPGVNTFFTTDSPITSVLAFADFYEAIKTALPNDVTVTIPSTGSILDEVTGAVEGAWTATDGGSVTGTDAGGYAAPTGAVINWLTAAVVDRRILRGRTFLVPLGAANYEGNGTLTGGLLAVLEPAADALLADLTPELVVWHRPVSEVGGLVSPVVRTQVPDKAAVLRSRRD